MGLGKTIEVLSLIHSNPFDPQIHKYFESSRNGSNSTTPATDFSNILKRSKGGKSVSIAPKSECKPQATRFCPATLIVCPLNVLNQWKQEAIACLGLDETRVAFYYGDQRSGVPEFFSSASLNPETYCASSYSGPNLVLTTYHTLASENSDRSSSSSLSYLYQVKWFRVILGEL